MKKILFFAFGVWISIVSFGQGQAVKDSLQAIVGDSIGNSLQQISSSDLPSLAPRRNCSSQSSMMPFKSFLSLLRK